MEQQHAEPEIRRSLLGSAVVQELILPRVSVREDSVAGIFHDGLLRHCPKARSSLFARDLRDKRDGSDVSSSRVSPTAHVLRVSLTYLFQWNSDHQPPHDIIELEVPFGALRMGILAADAILGHSKIRIDGLEVTGLSYLNPHTARTAMIKIRKCVKL